MSLEKYYISNIEISALSRDELFKEIKKNNSKKTLHLHSVNLQHIGLFGKYSKNYHRIRELSRGKRVLNLIDGMPILKHINKKYRKEHELLAGSDLFKDLLSSIENFENKKLLIFGGTKYSHQLLAKKIKSDFPDLITYFISPSKSELTDKIYLEDLRKYVFKEKIGSVILSIPKPLSDFIALEYLSSSNIIITAAFGGASDFYVGVQRRAPMVFRSLGIEWFFRFLSKPSKFFKRYILEGPREYIQLKTTTSISPTILTPQTIRNFIQRNLLIVDTVLIFLSSYLAGVSRHIFQDSLKSYSPNYIQIYLIATFILFVSFLFKSRTPRSIKIDSELFLNHIISVLFSISFVGLISYLFQLEISRGYLLFFTLFLISFGLISRLIFSIYLTCQRKNGSYMISTSLSNSISKNNLTVKLLFSNPKHGYLNSNRRYKKQDIYHSDGLTLATDNDTDILLRNKFDFNIKPEVMIVPENLSIANSRISPELIGTSNVIHLLPYTFDFKNNLFKRFFDLTISLIIFIFILPLLIFIFLLIRVVDGKNVIFYQERVGLNNNPFTIYKFRTMVIGAEEKVEELIDLNEGGKILFKIKNDPRITPLGKFLRKYSLDELPQLLNVIKGDMSLVGPRPALNKEVSKYSAISQIRHFLKPGITGLWQVSGRSNISDSDALELDLFYVSNWSLYLDSFILLKTIKVLFSKEGAY